jgi:hypothetical protein
MMTLNPYRFAYICDFKRHRRVKCDEAKPECRRCTKLGITCEGYKPYIPVRARKEKRTTQTRQLLPKNDLPQSPNSSPSVKLAFRNEAEERYFRAYLTKTAISVTWGEGDNISRSLWARIIMQAAHDEYGLRELIIAIGAFTVSQELRQTGHAAEGAKMKQFALQRYGEAIREMNLRLSEISYDEGTRKALIGCLLICCFEGLLGNTFMTLKHAESGNKVLRKWIKKYGSNNRKAGIASPAPLVIEDEIVQAYLRIDEQVTTFRGTRDDEEHENVLEETSGTIAGMPTSFSNKHEARMYLELIERRTAHFGCLLAGGFKFSVEPDLLREHDQDQDQELTRFKRAQVLRDLLLDEIERWTAAFDRSSRYEPEATTYMTGLYTLLARSKVLEIMVGISLSPDPKLYEKYLPQFQTIVDSCEKKIQLMKNFQQHGDYKFESGIIMPLHTTAKLCPDRALRRRAIALMRAHTSSDGEPMREGVWDSATFATWDEVIMEAEEGEQDISGGPKCRVTSIICDRATKQIRLEIVRGNDEKMVVGLVDWRRLDHCSQGMKNGRQFGDQNEVLLPASKFTCITPSTTWEGMLTIRPGGCKVGNQEVSPALGI